MTTARLALASLLIAQCTLAPLQAEGPWGPMVLLDSRIPLEISQIRQDPTDGKLFVPVLFDLAANSLEIGRVDLTVDPPTVNFAAVATGNIFALGTAGQAGNQIGFSFIDPSFDGRFGTCTLPCNGAANLLVNAGTWIDSSSSASADDFFVALLDNNANHGVTIYSSTNNGINWNPLNSLLPPEPGGVYDNFHGGKRIQLLVDPAAVNPATTRNCLFYEVRPAPGTTTTMRLNCRDGATPGFDVPLGTDVPNPTNQFDPLIENGCILVNDGGGGFDTICVINHRQTAQTRVLRVSDTGVVTGPFPLAPVTGGTGFPGISIHAASGDDEVRIHYPAVGEAPARDITSNPQAGSFVAPGPPAREGPVSTTAETNTQPNPNADFMTVLMCGNALSAGDPTESLDPLQPLVVGLALARKEIPLFADGWDTNNFLRWSSSAP